MNARERFTIESYVPRFTQRPPGPLIDAATVALAEFLIAFPFDPTQQFFRINPPNEIDTVFRKFAKHTPAVPKFSLDWAVFQAWESKMIVIEKRMRPAPSIVDPDDPDGDEIPQPRDEFLVLWSLPSLIEWWRNQYGTPDRQTDKK
jgi:hypothetical protein